MNCVLTDYCLLKAPIFARFILVSVNLSFMESPSVKRALLDQINPEVATKVN